MNAPPPPAALQLAAGASIIAPTEEFLVHFVNAIQNPVFVKDEQFRFVFFNNAFCTLLGQPRETLAGQTDYDVVPADQAAFFQEADRKVLASGEPIENEEMLTGADGSEYWLVTRKSIFEVPGRGRFLVGIITDITARKRVEKDLVAAKVLAEDANRAKSQFLANMSHELRTPLNAVIGFAEIIQNELLGPINEPRYREYAGDIHRSGASLLRLINDILDLTRVEAGTYQLREEVCDVANIVADAIRMMQNLALQNEIELRSAVPADLPFLLADERCVRQVVMNFLSNGVKFTPKGGHVDVGARVEPDGAIVISVTDTGIGIAKADIPRALGTFRQLENSLSRKYEGTGLGLPLVKSLLQLHQGELQVESEVGAGTTASAHFPASRTIQR